MKSWRGIAIAGLVGLGVLSLPAYGADQARPGTVNYTEGAVYLDGQPLNSKNIGSTDMSAGQVLSTGQGKAEVLLTPGIFLRVDDNSSVKMISPSLTPTQVELEKGRASVEVDQLLKENVVQVVNGGVTTQLMKTGYYQFDASNPTVGVSKGEARVQLANGQSTKVKGGRQLALASGQIADLRIDSNSDRLMNWSKLRSQYLSQANNQLASQYYSGGYYPGWYWNPWYGGYTYLGASPLYSPFGWGFYPRGWYSGFGWGGAGFYGSPSVIYRGGYPAGAYHGGFPTGGPINSRSFPTGGIRGGAHGGRR